MKVWNMIQFRLKELIVRKERLERRRITYAVINEHTGISPSTLARMANNATEMVGLSVIDRLCDFLACAPGELMVHVDSHGTHAIRTAESERPATRR